MTKQVRQSVFETNSSSTHSISIASGFEGDGLMDTIGVVDKGGVPTVVLTGGQFGWEVEDYNDADTKANYAAIYAQQWAGERQEEFERILTDVIKEQTGCEAVEFAFSFSFSEDDWSYIDHQSVECGVLDYLFEDPKELRQFIFNPRSTLHTDNDNY